MKYVKNTKAISQNPLYLGGGGGGKLSLTNLKQIATKSLKKLVALSLLATLAITTGACDGQKTIDKTPPTLKSHNLGADKQIISSRSIVLTFNEALKNSSVNQTNIKLQTKNAVALDKAKYKVEQDSNDKTKVKISLLDEVLKNTTADYKIVIGALEDEAGNKFKDGKQNTKTIEFKFLDSVAPTVKSHNLSTSKQINSNKSIVLIFSEPLKADSVNQTSIKLQNKSGVKLDNTKYKVEQDSTNKAKVKITLLDDELKKTTADFTIAIGAVKDEANNSFKTSYSKNINFKFLESIAPTFISDNLGTPKQINSSETIVLVFSEALKKASVNTTNVELENESRVALDKAKYKVEQDSNDKTKVKISLLDEVLKNTTADYKIVIGALEDEAGNKFKDANNNQKIIDFKFLDLIAPKFTGSNIAGKNILSGTTKVVLAFNEKLRATSENKVSITKGGSNFSSFNATLTGDKKAIEISFYNHNELNNISQTYKITLPSTILDLAGNKLVNPQVLELNKNIQANDANTIYATPEGAGNKDGKSWTNAKTFNNALKNASNGQTILVAQGSYYADPNKTDITKTFILKDGVKIYGGFDPSDVNKARDFTASILEGKLSSSLNSKQILTGKNLSATSILDGFLIQNALNGDQNAKGGGLHLNKSSPKLNNLTFNNNKLTGNSSSGGAIYADTYDSSIINSNFSNNSAFNGGAIYSYNSSPSINNSNFKNNSTATSGHGGAIYNSNSESNISNSSFSNNSADSGGGAIYNYDRKNTSISNVIFINNSAYKGAAINSSYSYSNLSISNVVFINNSGMNGAIYNNNSSPKIYNSILWNDKNKSKVLIHNSNRSSNPIIKNSILNKNSAVTQIGVQNWSAITTPYNFMDFSDTKFKANQTLVTFSIDAKGKVASANQALIKNKGDNALYKEVTKKEASSDKDLAGNPRLQGGTIDIGAYEIQD